MVRETRHLWVGNLPDNIREDRVKEHFKRYGRVQNVKILGRADCPIATSTNSTNSSGACATVAFMDIKSASKAFNAEHILDERTLTTEYYEPAAIPTSASGVPSAGSSPAGSGYSGSSSSVNSAPPASSVASRYPTSGGEDNITTSVTDAAAAAAAMVATAAAPANWRGTNDSATEYCRRGNTPAYARYQRNNSAPYSTPPPNTERSSHHRWYGDRGGGESTPSTPGGTTETTGRRRLLSGSGEGSSRSGSSSPDQSDESRTSTPAPLGGSQNNLHTHRSSHSHQSSSTSNGRPLAICVRNLPTRSTDSSLKDGLYHEYKKHGKVVWVKIVGQNADRYAIVRFKKPSDVEKALEVSQDKSFFGCKISVGPHQSCDDDAESVKPYETDIDEYHPKATRTLFIGNLEKDVTQQLLRDKFKHFGRIIEIDIKKGSSGGAGYAFCQYASISSVVEAIRAMDGEYVGTSRVKLGFGKPVATTCVWVDGLTEHTEKQVLSAVSRCGSATSVCVDRAAGAALVHFEQASAAGAAVRELRRHAAHLATADPQAPRLCVDYASRECQDAFYEQLEKHGGSAALAGSERLANEVTSRYIPSIRHNKIRYETSTPRSRASSYTRGLSRTSRYSTAEHYDPTEYAADRRYRLYEETSSSPLAEDVPFEERLQSSVASPHRSRKHRRDSSPEEHRHSKDWHRSVVGTNAGVVCTVTESRRSSHDGRHRSRSGSRRRHRRRREDESSRAGTPLRDEVDALPCDPRPPPSARECTAPMVLPLPKFAEQWLQTITRTEAKPVEAPPRPPSASSSSSGSAPHSPSISLEERIRSLDEKYERWSRLDAPAQNTARPKLRHRLLELDFNEVKPSDVVRSLLAKRSVFDEDSERLQRPSGSSAGSVALTENKGDISLLPHKDIASADDEHLNDPDAHRESILPKIESIKIEQDVSHDEPTELLTPKVEANVSENFDDPVSNLEEISRSIKIEKLDDNEENTNHASDVHSENQVSTNKLDTDEKSKIEMEIKIEIDKMCQLSCYDNDKNNDVVSSNNDVCVNPFDDRDDCVNVSVSNNCDSSCNDQSFLSLNEPSESDNKSENIDQSRNISENEDKSTNISKGIDESFNVSNNENKTTNSQKSHDKFTNIPKIQDSFTKIPYNQEKSTIIHKSIDKISKFQKQDEKLTDVAKSENLSTEISENVDKFTDIHKSQEGSGTSESIYSKNKITEKSNPLSNKEITDRHRRKSVSDKEKNNDNKSLKERRKSLDEIAVKALQIKQEKLQSEIKKEDLHKPKKDTDNSSHDVKNNVDKSNEMYKNVKKEKHKELEKDEKHKSRKESDHRRESKKEDLKYTKLNKDDVSKHVSRKDLTESSKSNTHHDHNKIKQEHSSTKSNKIGSLSVVLNNIDNHHSFKDSKTEEHINEKTYSNEKCNDRSKHKVEHHSISKTKTEDRDKQRHYSFDSTRTEKRKERLSSSSSLPSHIGHKRRMSSQDCSYAAIDEMKKPKSESRIERRNSKDSRSHERSKNNKLSKDNFAKLFGLKSKDDKKNHVITSDVTEDNKQKEDEKIKIFSSNIEDDTNTSKSRSVEETLQECKESLVNDLDFLATLELRSSEENEKQKALRIEMKEKKRLQQLQQIHELQLKQDAIQCEYSSKNKDDKKKLDEKRRDSVHEKRMSTERKSKDDKNECKRKSSKNPNTSDTSDSDEPKKHSIFDIVDEGPTYISMYDKVKARSCKNMQKQEEEKRQEKIKAKFSQLKQCRAKKEEKKRSSWDEDSESDNEERNSHKPNCSSDGENSMSEQNKPNKYGLCFDSDRSLNSDCFSSTHRQDYGKHEKYSRKNSKVRIVSDSSDDDHAKQGYKSRDQTKHDLFSDTDSFLSDCKKGGHYSDKDCDILPKEFSSDRVKKNSLLNLFGKTDHDDKRKSLSSEITYSTSNYFKSSAEFSSDYDSSNRVTEYTQKKRKKRSKLKCDVKPDVPNHLNSEFQSFPPREKVSILKEEQPKSKSKSNSEVHRESYRESHLDGKKDGKMLDIFGPLSDDSDSTPPLNNISSYENKGEKIRNFENNLEIDSPKCYKEQKHKENINFVKEDENSLDVDAVSKAIEARLFSDADHDNYSKNDGYKINGQFVSKRDFKEKRKKKKRHKLARRAFHHDKEDDVLFNNKKHISSTKNTNESLLNTSNVTDTSNTIDQVPMSSSLPRLTDSPPITLDVDDRIDINRNKPLSQNEIIGPTKDSTTPIEKVLEDKSPKICSDNTTQLDSESIKTNELPKDSTSENAPLSVTSMVENKKCDDNQTKTPNTEEKPRAVISQEETEDAVAALLGESFGGNNVSSFEKCFDEDSENSTSNVRDNSSLETENILEEDAEEMRRAVQNLNACEMEAKPDTPMSDNDLLLIDTDNEEHEEVTNTVNSLINVISSNPTHKTNEVKPNTSSHDIVVSKQTLSVGVGLNIVKSTIAYQATSTTAPVITSWTLTNRKFDNVVHTPNTLNSEKETENSNLQVSPNIIQLKSNTAANGCSMRPILPRMGTPLILNPIIHTSVSNMQPPTIKIPDTHIMYQKPQGIVISPRLSETRLISPKSSSQTESTSPRLANMTILSPTHNLNLGMVSPGNIQQRSPGHVTVVRMQQPPLSPIQAVNLPPGTRTVMTNKPSSLVLKTMGAPIHFNKIANPPVLTPKQITGNATHINKGVLNSPISAHFNDVKMEERIHYDEYEIKKNIFSTANLQNCTNPTIMAQNRLISMQSVNTGPKLQLSNKVILNSLQLGSEQDAMKSEIKKSLPHVPYANPSIIHVTGINHVTGSSIHSTAKPIFTTNKPRESTPNVLHTLTSPRLITSSPIGNIIHLEPSNNTTVLSMAPTRQTNVVNKANIVNAVSVTTSSLTNVVMTPLLLKTGSSLSTIRVNKINNDNLIQEPNKLALHQKHYIRDGNNAVQPDLNDVRNYKFDHDRKEATGYALKHEIVDNKVETDFEELLKDNINEIKVNPDDKKLEVNVGKIPQQDNVKISENFQIKEQRTVESQTIHDPHTDHNIKDSTAKHLTIQRCGIQDTPFNSVKPTYSVSENLDDRKEFNSESVIKKNEAVDPNFIQKNKDDKIENIETNDLLSNEVSADKPNNITSPQTTNEKANNASKRGRAVRGKKAKNPEKPIAKPISKTARGTPGKRGRGKAHLDKKNKQSDSHLPGDIYDFHEDSGDETAIASNQADSRPRLILTIKSPLSGQNTSLTSSTPNVPSQIATVPPQAPKDIDYKKPEELDDKAEDFSSPLNTRKSRRLLEKDIQKTSEDSDDKTRLPKDIKKRQTRQTNQGVKVNNLDKSPVRDPRKSPRGMKRTRDRSVSVSSEDNVKKEEPVREVKLPKLSPQPAPVSSPIVTVQTLPNQSVSNQSIMNTIVTSVATHTPNTIITPTSLQEKEHQLPRKNVVVATPIPITKPPKKMISEISAKLASAFEAAATSGEARIAQQASEEAVQEPVGGRAIVRGLSPALAALPSPASVAPNLPAFEPRLAGASAEAPRVRTLYGATASLPRGAHHPPPPPHHLHRPLPGATARMSVTSVPNLSPQGQNYSSDSARRPPPAHQQTSPVTPGDGVYPHFSHQHYQMYQQHFRATQHEARATPSPYTRLDGESCEVGVGARVPLGCLSPSACDVRWPSPPPAHLSRLGPAHASQVPREADSLQMLLRRYPVMWQGLLALKNDSAAVQMHFVGGNPAVAASTLPRHTDGSTPPLRIAQRMRLEPVQLDQVHRKMKLENEHCILLALPCGRDHMDVLQQSTNLTSGFITYLQRKLAAGIVNVAPPGHQQAMYTVHIFPSCDFANENLNRIAPDLMHRVADIAHLLIVIATV